MTTTGPRCPWKIRWGLGHDTQCDKRDHLTGILTHNEHDQVVQAAKPDPQHEGPSGVMPGQRILWTAGDRREYTGDYPGPCTATTGCTLHTGHHGRCAP